MNLVRSTFNLNVKRDRELDLANDHCGCVSDFYDVRIASGVFLLVEGSLSDHNTDLLTLIHRKIINKHEKCI